MFNLLKAALEIAPRNDIRYYLNGVHFKREGDTLCINAADGRVMLQATCHNAEWISRIEDCTDVVVEQAELTNALKMFKKGQDVPLTVQGGVVTINGLVLPVVNCRFPDVDRVIRGRGKDGTVTGITYPVLEKIAKAGKIAVNVGGASLGKLTCGDGTSTLKWESETPDFSLLMLQSPARL